MMALAPIVAGWLMGSDPLRYFWLAPLIGLARIIREA
jgi:hypothetical protein